ncbi:MAG: exopolysaccharide biosynthesis polyprenyl glycosylphosphotransferase [Candidatus Dormibacteria bacterium]
MDQGVSSGAPIGIAADWPPPSHPGYDLLKRLSDVVISAGVLVVGSPLWLAIALAVRATSEGPALFQGPVIGKDCRIFTYFKFRSMVRGDDSRHREWLREFVRSDSAFGEAKGKQVYKAVDDPRITPLGAVLRRFSVDEVPQLINVLRGEMSLVGPRPPIPAEFEHYDDSARLRLGVKPGVTGLYQVTARSQVPFSGMLAIDLDYIGRRSTWLDFQIMARTVWVMLRGRGAG